MFRKAMRFPGLMMPVLIIAFLGLLSGCGTGGLSDAPAGSSTGGTTGGTTPAIPVIPASLDLLVSNAQLNSDVAGAPTVTLTAIVKDSSNRALADQTVAFSADSGVLSEISEKTDANGRATAKLGNGGDPTYRTIKVSATLGSVPPAYIYVAVTGTKVSIDPASFSMSFNDSAGKTLVISLKDSAGKVIKGKTISLSSLTGKSTFSAASYVTDDSGQITVTVKNATDTIGDTITATAIGVSSQSALTINTAKLVVNAPVDPQVWINTSQAFTVTYTKNGIAPSPEQKIHFTTTRGTLTDPLTNLPVSSSMTVGGVATVHVSSTNSGPAVLTAYTADGTAQVSTQVSIFFVANTAEKMTLSAYPAVINFNNPDTTSEQSLIKAIVRDASDNLVMGKTVNFSVTQDASAGSLTKASATTDMYGTATTNYIAGSVTGGAYNVVIGATVQDRPTVTATTTLTVGGQALFISLATGPTIQKVEPNKYQKDYVALVTAAGGGAVANAVVTATVTPQYYMKGYYYQCGSITSTGIIVLDHWCQMQTLVSSKSTLPSVPACANEDGILQNSLYDFNGILDTDPVTRQSEDQNANSRLDPGNVVSVTAATTDSTGHSTVSLVYARDYAFWANVRLEVRASMWGSTTMAVQTFDLQGAAADYADKTIDPPGRTSPFGSNTTCFAALSVLALEPTKISLNWDRSADASSYNIYRERTNPPQAAAVKITNVTTTTYFDTVQAGGTYCYEIKQVNSSGDESLLSPANNRVCAASQPTAPAGVIATSLSPTQINVSWDDAGAVSYRIYRDGIRIQESVTRSIVDSNLSANTMYCYAVASLDSAGNESAKSSTACETTQLAAPSTPTVLTATGRVDVGATGAIIYRVDLTWTASAGAELYKIYRDGALVLSATGLTATDTNVVGQTGYCYAVSALYRSGSESAQSTQFCTATP